MTPVTIITTCKGRMKHLRIALDGWLAATPCPIIVVLDGCPDFQPGALPNLPRLRVIHTGSYTSDLFRKPLALNLGASAARTDHLLFLDADTLVSSGFWSWYSRRVVADAMFVVPAKLELRDLTGVLGTPRADFLSVGGVDEGFVGWGSEDLDLRLRLFLARSLRLIDIPEGFLTSIPHDDALRTRFYDESNKDLSQRKNLDRLIHNVEKASGLGIWELLENRNVQRLFYVAALPERNKPA